MADVDYTSAGAGGHTNPSYLSYPKQQPPKTKTLNQEEWERRQRLREYRVAARREKRNRKADEKKQRKLNATILRRMTRNSEKYTKNVARNRDRAIMLERRKIQYNAVRAVQRLAAIHDPSGKKFNVAPVVLQQDRTVITQEALDRRRNTQERRAALEKGEKPLVTSDNLAKQIDQGAHSINSERMKLVENGLKTQGLSKRQMKKLAKFEPRPPLPKPIIPQGMDFPSDEEENWLVLWDLPDNELHRRVEREKKRAAKARKELRSKQQSGKAERRAARDEKRKVYKSLKETWKTLREEERKRRRVLQTQEDEEGKRLAISLHKKYREDALKAAAELGFTFDNVPGVSDIKPKLLGMKGVEVDWNDLELVGESAAGVRIKGPAPENKFHKNRVDLSNIASESSTQQVFGNDTNDTSPGFRDPLTSDFLSLNDTTMTSASAAGEHATRPLTLNNHTRRKLRRAFNASILQKELLVRKAAITHCKTNSIVIPPALLTPTRPSNTRGSLTLPSGLLETSKQERVRGRVELAEFNRWARVLRRQAKSKAIEAGIRVYLELMGRIPRDVTLREEGMVGRGHEDVEGMISAADWIANWPMPGVEEGRFGDYEDERDYEFGAGSGFSKGEIGADRDEAETGEESGDSAARQLMGEMRASVDRGDKETKRTKVSAMNTRSSSASESGSDSDSDSSSASSASHGRDRDGSASASERDDSDEDEDDGPGVEMEG